MELIHKEFEPNKVKFVDCISKIEVKELNYRYKVVRDIAKWMNEN